MEAVECKTFEHQIEDFFDDQLDDGELDSFLHHTETCPECREELTIRLLIRMGLMRLEDGKNFHLGNEYERMIENARQRLARRMRLKRVAWLSIGAVILALVAVVVITTFVLIL